MKKYRLTIAFISLTILLVQTTHAATLQGHAYKCDQSDHSGITITLSALHQVPTVGIMGSALLLFGFGLLLFRKRSNALRILIPVFFAIGAVCITYAVFSRQALQIQPVTILSQKWISEPIVWKHLQRDIHRLN